ncbi:MAG TPA: cupin domain-containing protein [Kofleriaceae bacterium]|nr:cupin domain-containing protein [Kofleriaceae bacterium]
MPHAQPSSCGPAAELFNWEVLGRVLADRPDALVVTGGKLLAHAPPRTLDEMHAYLSAGLGLCIRHGERHDDGLANVAQAFSVFGRAHVQLFVTAGRTHGFGWHYDDEEVFIAQTAGHKHYYFRSNTVAADEPARGAIFARYPQERSPMAAATLIAGDFLYLPSRWWHMAVCEETALSISVGVAPTSAPLEPRPSA